MGEVVWGTDFRAKTRPDPTPDLALLAVDIFGVLHLPDFYDVRPLTTFGFDAGGEMPPPEAS